MIKSSERLVTKLKRRGGGKGEGGIMQRCVPCRACLAIIALSSLQSQLEYSENRTEKLFLSKKNASVLINVLSQAVS